MTNFSTKLTWKNDSSLLYLQFKDAYTGYWYYNEIFIAKFKDYKRLILAFIEKKETKTTTTTEKKKMKKNFLSNNITTTKRKNEKKELETKKQQQRICTTSTYTYNVNNIINIEFEFETPQSFLNFLFTLTCCDYITLLIPKKSFHDSFKSSESNHLHLTRTRYRPVKLSISSYAYKQLMKIINQLCIYVIYIYDAFNNNDDDVDNDNDDKENNNSNSNSKGIKSWWRKKKKMKKIIIKSIMKKYLCI